VDLLARAVWLGHVHAAEVVLAELTGHTLETHLGARALLRTHRPDLLVDGRLAAGVTQAAQAAEHFHRGQRRPRFQDRLDPALEGLH
jgi:hypothetical protein